jgi:hypothetical protein
LSGAISNNQPIGDVLRTALRARADVFIRSCTDKLTRS